MMNFAAFVASFAEGTNERCPLLKNVSTGLQKHANDFKEDNKNKVSKKVTYITHELCCYCAINYYTTINGFSNSSPT